MGRGYRNHPLAVTLVPIQYSFVVVGASKRADALYIATLGIYQQRKEGSFYSKTPPPQYSNARREAVKGGRGDAS